MTIPPDDAVRYNSDMKLKGRAAHMSRRTSISIALAVVIASVAGASPASATKPSLGCGPGFSSPGELTLGEALKLFVDVPPALIRGAWDHYDKNGDGKLCTKHLPDTPGIPADNVNITDNNSSKP